MNFLNAKQPNAIAVTKLLLKELKVKVNNQTIIDRLTEHPEFPSFLALSDCLNEWAISNQSYQLDKENFDPNDLLFPFIAHSNQKGGLFILIHEIVNEKIIYSDENNAKKTLTTEAFLKWWSGKAFHATATENSGERDYKSNRIQAIFSTIKIPTLILLLLTTIVLNINWITISIGFSALLFLKLIGVSVAIILLMHSIDTNNPLVQNLCSLGDKNNCNAILKSDAAKVTSWLSWSEVGFFYFSGSLLSLIFAPSSLFLIVWLNALAAPYIIYSLTYQFRNKNWCILCCAIQAILVLELGVNLIFNANQYQYNNSIINAGNILVYTICFLLPILSWTIIKSFLLKSVQFKPLKQQLKKFKYNSELFNKVLTSQPRYAVPDDLMPIVLGNPAAPITLTMVSNPFCGPCATAHQTLDQWLKTREDIQLKIIFTTADHDDDEKTKVARHVSALSKLKDSTVLEQALNDWYAQKPKKYDQWANNYPVQLNSNENEVTQKQKAWCALTEITFTPTIMVNGFKLPEPYRLEDIKYLLN